MPDDLEIAKRQLEHAWRWVFGSTPEIDVEATDGILTITDEGAGIARSQGGGWHDWHTVTTPGTRWDPPDADIREGETVASSADAVRALVRRVVEDRLDCSIMDELGGRIEDAIPG